MCMMLRTHLHDVRVDVDVRGRHEALHTCMMLAHVCMMLAHVCMMLCTHVDDVAHTGMMLHTHVADVGEGVDAPTGRMKL